MAKTIRYGMKSDEALKILNIERNNLNPAILDEVINIWFPPFDANFNILKCVYCSNIRNILVLMTLRKEGHFTYNQKFTERKSV